MALSLSYELVVKWRCRVLGEITFIGAWGCLFLLHALQQGASACPDKSGHTRNAELPMIRHVGRCPDLLGPAGALLLGHETKKDISMLLSAQLVS